MKGIFLSDLLDWADFSPSPHGFGAAVAGAPDCSRTISGVGQGQQQLSQLSVAGGCGGLLLGRPKGTDDFSKSGHL